MNAPHEVLLVAATEPEVAALVAALRDPRRDEADDAHAVPGSTVGVLEGVPIRIAVLGVGKTNTAWGLTALALQHRPRAVLQTGIAGAYPNAFLAVGSAVCAGEEHDLDAGLLRRDGPLGMAALGFGLAPWAVPPRDDRFPVDAAWSEPFAIASGIPPQPFATSDAVSGDLDVAGEREARSDAALESMEGAAAAQVCLRLGLPFAEVRGVSNVAGQRDAVSWDARTALRACERVIRGGLAEHARATAQRGSGA